MRLGRGDSVGVGGKLGGTLCRCGGGGGVAGARGSRCGGGGGAERIGAGIPPREDGGGGIREGKLPLLAGRGTTLTGRGATLAGDSSPAVLLAVALGSFSSPIETRSGCSSAASLGL